MSPEINDQNQHIKNRLKNFNHQCKQSFLNNTWAGTFVDYLKLVETNPEKHTRTTFQLVQDMIEFYGVEILEDAGEDVIRYKLFDDPFTDGLNKIFGLERTIMKLVKYIKSSAREEGKERIFVFHGPVGTAKTSIFDLISKGLEDYTKTHEGDVYSIRWVFDKNFTSSSNMGFFPADDKDADTELGEIVANLPCQLHDHPLLVIPRKIRRQYLTDLFKKQHGSNSSWVIPRKILGGELCYNCRQIYDFLMQKYNGNWEKVLKHVRVERFHFSEIAGRGLAKVFPEGNVSTSAQSLTIDENIRFIGNLITNINLVKFNGKYVAGNRGLVHYSDIYKRNIMTLQHLLAAIEERRIEFGDIQADIDIMILGTTNSYEYYQLRENPLSSALRSRVRKIDVPYLLSYSDEQKIYDKTLVQAKKYRHIMPHTTELAAMFAILTRLEKSNLTKILPEEFFKKINTPFNKALIYNNEIPDELTQLERKMLTKEIIRTIRNENPIQDMNEGMRGMPTRILQNIFADLCEQYPVNNDSSQSSNSENLIKTQDCISPFQVFNLLEKVIALGAINYDFLAIEVDEGFHDTKNFIDQLRNRFDKIISKEVEEGLVQINVEDLDKMIRQYLKHVSAFNNKEKIVNEISKEKEDPDEKIMLEVENAVGVKKEERNFWRFNILSRATSFATSDKKLDIRHLYKDIYDALYSQIYENKKNKINWAGISNSLSKIKQIPDIENLEIDNFTKNRIKSLLETLIHKYKYCIKCAIRISQYFIENRSRLIEHK